MGAGICVGMVAQYGRCLLFNAVKMCVVFSASAVFADLIPHKMLTLLGEKGLAGWQEKLQRKNAYTIVAAHNEQVFEAINHASDLAFMRINTFLLTSGQTSS